MSRVFLVGEYNPLGADPRLALFPRPPNSAGGRLCRVLGLTGRQYLKAFERRNLLSGPRETFRWKAPDAREAARKILAETTTEDGLVLLGARVAVAFGVDFRAALFEPRPSLVVGRGLRRSVLVLPHPSGRSREWNEPGAAERARLAVEAMLARARPTP